MISFNDLNQHSLDERHITYYNQFSDKGGSYIDILIDGVLVSLDYGKNKGKMKFDMRKLQLLTKAK